jgi:UDP:flavonoid glycosyltransferase YjiC (YdhE family)
MLQDPPGHIVFCVLNWGLGHATRSVPLIRHALDLGFELTIASDGYVLDFLKAEFPGCATLKLPGYNVRYHFKSAPLNMLVNGIRIMSRIRAEQRTLEIYLKAHPAAYILSDNRYGCYSKAHISILISHHLHVRGMFKLARVLGNRLIRRWAGRFSGIWIPDFADRNLALAGAISDPLPKLRCQYLGPLSSFTLIEKPVRQDLLIVLSGPEPQRTIFEKKILAQLGHMRDLHILLIRGKPGEDKIRLTSPNHRVKPIMQRHELNHAMAESSVVLCRSGYSSVMDLHVLAKPAILVPTPGQPEQEYLAKRLSHSPNFVTGSQEDFKILQLLQELKTKRSGEITYFKPEEMEEAIAGAFLSFGIQPGKDGKYAD